MKGQGSRRVKIGPVSKIDKIWLYCVCMSSVTKNDYFKSLASYLGICDVIKTTYHTHATFLMGYDVKNDVVYHFSECLP